MRISCSTFGLLAGRPTLVRTLLPLNGSTAPSCQILMVERLAYQGLDYCLSTDVQFPGGLIQFFQHAWRQVNIHPLYGTRHASVVGEEPRHIFSFVRQAGDGFCRYWFPTSTSVLHKVAAPAWLLSRESRDGSTRLLRPPALRKCRSTSA